jgi:hypothetical protein
MSTMRNISTTIPSNTEAITIPEYPLIILFILIGAILLMSSSDLVSMFLAIELQSYGCASCEAYVEAILPSIIDRPKYDAGHDLPPLLRPITSIGGIAGRTGRYHWGLPPGMTTLSGDVYGKVNELDTYSGAELSLCIPSRIMRCIHEIAVGGRPYTDGCRSFMPDSNIGITNAQVPKNINNVNILQP